ncbi:hypothetical protein EI94DRAFT_1701201 [Lactarius quietus]|nr:hypothetical protein EI94DRAFT_1701201 [Lactarius quietus]
MCKEFLPRQLLQDQQQKAKWLSGLKQLLPVHPREMLEMMKMLQDKYRGTSAAKASYQKRTRSQVKANGKQTKKIDSQRQKSPNLEDSCNESWQDEPVPIEESPSRRQDGRNEEGFHAKGKDNDKTFKDLKLEVQALTVRCNEYERIIKDLQSAHDTHKNILEMLWQQIVNLHDSQGTLSGAYSERTMISYHE